MRDSTKLARRARLTYELGRLRWGLPRGLAALPVGLLAYGAGVSSRECALLVGLLFAFVTLAAWRSRSALYGAWAGLALAVVPLLLAPFGMHAGHVCSSGVCFSVCALTSGAAGLFGGLWLGARLLRLETGRLHFLIAGALSLAATSLFACSAVGFGAVGGLALGVAGGMAPTLASWLASRVTE